MLSQLQRALPAAAVVAALTTVTCLVLLSCQRRSLLTDSGATRLAVQETLARLQALHPDSVEDAALRRAVEQVSHSRHVATVWLFAPDGRIGYSTGSTARSTAAYRTVEEAATDDTRRVIEALPDGALTGEQRTWLLAASAIRREGTHNDIYRHMVYPVRRTDGSTVALVGVAYNVTDAEVGLGWKVCVLAGALGLVVYWLSLPLWVFLDARDRGERAWTWATFVFIGNLVALIAYILARTPAPHGGRAISPAAGRRQ